MPKNLTGNTAAFPTQTSPLAGEPRTAGGVEAGFQNAADRTAFLNDRLIYLDPERGGVRRLRRFASVAEMKASIDFPALSVASVDGLGFFQFDVASVLAELVPLIIAPTSVGAGPGRWLRLDLGALNVANGIPQLDSSGKVPTSLLAAGDGDRIAAGTVRKTIADFQYVYVAGASFTSSTAFADVAGAAISIVAKAGDYLKLSLTGNILNTVTDQVAALRLLLTKPDTTTAVVDGSSLRSTGGPVANGQPISLTCVVPISADGTYSVKLQHAAIDTGSASSSVITITGELIRP